MYLRPTTINVIDDYGDYNILNNNIEVYNSQLLLTVLDGDKSFDYSASVSSDGGGSWIVDCWDGSRENLFRLRSSRILI